MNCPHCDTKMMALEYEIGHPERYDGTSEWHCVSCKTRVGRWTKRILREGEIEPRFGRIVA